MVDAAVALESASPRRRFRLRFSLRTFLTLVTVFSLVFGWLYTSAKQQERAVLAIEQLGGSVVYDWQVERDGAMSPDNPEPIPTGPEWLRNLLGPHFFDTAVSVDISQPRYDQTQPPEFAAFAGHLAKLPALKQLSVTEMSLNDDEYAMLARLRTLENLTLARMTITENGGREIARLKNLRKLNFDDDIVAAGALTNIKDMPQLESLSVCCRHEDFAPNGMSFWNLEKYAIRDDALGSLPSLPRLRGLSLTFTQITDDGVAILGRMPQLRNLGISSPQITNASMDHLTKLKHLEWLGISVSKMDSEGVAKLAEFPKLTGLRISGENIDNDCLPTIAKLGELQDLELGGKSVDDSGLRHLEGMKNLKKLDVQLTGVTTDGPEIKRLKAALPNCVVYQFYWTTPSVR